MGTRRTARRRAKRPFGVRADAFGPQMRRRGRDADVIWVWVGALGRHFCPCRPKRTQADEMGRPFGVALTIFIFQSFVDKFFSLMAKSIHTPLYDANQFHFEACPIDHPLLWHVFYASTTQHFFNLLF